MKSLVKLASIPHSTYYNLIACMNRWDPDADVKEEIKVIYEEYKGCYGYRCIRDELANRRQKVKSQASSMYYERIRFKVYGPYEKI